jgi:LysR family glycine cleavage system transcriptional activator
MRWLLPRFASFEKQYTSVEIRVSTRPIDFERDDIDCAIYYGRESHDDLAYEFLRDVNLIVVCAPSAISGERPLAEPADLARHQLLRAKLSTRMSEDWTTWFESAAVPRPQNLRELVLENRNLVIQAAQSGLGVAVVDPLMVEGELKSQKLIQPLQHMAKASGSYYLVYPAASTPPEKVVAFRNWLVGEMHKE